MNVDVVQLPGTSGVMRLEPPLTVTAEESDLGVEIIGRAVVDCRAAGLLAA